MNEEARLNNNNDAGVFDVKLKDDDLLTLIKKPIQESESYWNDTFGLKKIRQDNINLWLPQHWKGQDVYDYQEGYLYQDNRIFTSVETICSVVNSRIAQPEVTPAQDSITSLQVAKDLGKTLHAHSTKYQVDDLFRISVRNLLLKRVGFIKLRFDPHSGEHGEIVPEHVLPEDIIVDQDAKWNEVPRFIAQRLRNKSGEELCAMFPDAKQKIYELLGVNRYDRKGNLVAYKSQLAKKKNLWEVWFRYYDEKEEAYLGGLAFVDENFQYVLEKTKNPNWNYDSKDGRTSNLLDSPEPPFIPLNYLNDGTSYVDLTSMVEQAAPLQRVLDRRGFQIMENSELSGSGMIFNTLMITKEEISKLIGAPDEKVGVKGDVKQAFTRIPPPALPNYVIEDKEDARREIDNIFATHDISRGENSKNKTLGQDQIQQQQDYTRMDDIARAVERMITKYYRYLVQMMKVYYTEDHYFKAVGEDGQFDFIVMSSDLIEDGIDVTIEAGSTMPIDKRSQQKWVADLAGMGLLDPLSIYEVASGGNLPPPKKMLERYMLFKTDPMAFMGKVKEDDFSREAFMDVQILNGGEMPKPRDEYNDIYFKFINNYMLSGDFDKQPDLIKQMYVEHLRLAQTQAEKQLQFMMSQAPTEEDMQQTNQKAVEQAEVEKQVMGGQPDMQQPGEEQPADKGELANKMSEEDEPGKARQTTTPPPMM